MALYLSLPLWIDWTDIVNRASYFESQLNAMNPEIQDSVLQWVHDELYLPADAGSPITFKDGSKGGSPGSSQFDLTQVRRIQIALGAWGASFTIDNPAGTGSLSGVSIDAFSVSNTMAKNNSTAEDLLNANQYGTQASMLWEQRHTSRMMI